MQDLSSHRVKTTPENYQIRPENYLRIVFRSKLVELSPIVSGKIL